MENLVLMSAVLLALAALIVAILADVRTRRATRALSRELVGLREHVRALESGHGEHAPTDSGATAAHELAVVVTPRLSRLEKRLAELTENPQVATGAVSPDDGETRVVRALRRQGYADIVVMETLGSGAVCVEAQFEGMTVKGIAQADAAGQVEFAAVSSARAFP